MRRGFAVAAIAVAVCSALSARAAWREAGPVGDPATWRRHYEFPRYSEIFFISIDDPNPSTRTEGVEALIAAFGGVQVPEDVSHHRALPNDTFALVFDIPRKSAAGAAAALVKNYKASNFSRREFAMDPSLDWPNPAELYAKRDALAAEWTTLEPQEKKTPAIHGLISAAQMRFPILIGLYEDSEKRAGIYVWVSREPKPAVITPSLWGSEVVISPAAASGQRPVDPAFWARRAEGVCSVNNNPEQITLVSHAPFDAALNSRAALKRLGAHPLPESCRLPSRLSPEEDRSMLADASDWLVPDSKLDRLPKDLAKLGQVAYFGPIEAVMWPSVSDAVDLKVRMLSDEMKKNAAALAQTPLIRALVSAEIERLTPSVGVYDATKGATAVHVLILAPPLDAPR